MKNFLGKLRRIDVIVGFLIIFKIIFFYIITDITSGSILVGLVTLGVIGITFYSTLLSKNTKSWKAFIVVYSIISVLMFIDSVYYSYFNQLISINQIRQMDKLIVINKSFKFVAPPISTIIILDIPFIGLYFKRLKNTIINVNYVEFALRKRIAITLLFASFILLVLNPFDADSVKAINHNEVITYHIYDIYTNIFGESDNIIESEEDVMKVIEGSKSEPVENLVYKGIGKGRNLILVQVESLENFAINTFYEGQEITPNLNSLVKESSTMYFSNYYQTIGKGNTSDAEFSSLNSIYPNIEGSCYDNYYENTYNGLPWIMRDNGYYAMAFHGYKGDFWNREDAYPYQGFQDFYSAEDFTVTDTMGFGMVDGDFFDQTATKLETLQQPFFSFIITLSSHHPYEVSENFTEIEVKEEDKNTEFGNYMQAINYTDRSIGGFIADLKEKGLYNNSVIVFYGDHYALNCMKDGIDKQMTEFLGYDYDYDEMLNIPLIIHIPGTQTGGTFDITGGEVDLLPTIANIMGVEINNPYIFGRDLLNSGNNGFVASVTYLLRGSFVSDGVMFEFSKDAIFEESRAWDINTKVPVSIDGYLDEYTRAKNLLDASRYVLDNDLIIR